MEVLEKIFFDLVINFLEKNETLYLKNFGVFKLKKKSAEIKKSVILPPKFEVVFFNLNEINEIKENIYIIKKTYDDFINFVCLFIKNLDKQRVKIELQHLINKIKNEIVKDKRLEVSNIGYFYIDNKGKIKFFSYESFYSKSLYGLQSINLNKYLSKSQIVKNILDLSYDSSNKIGKKIAMFLIVIFQFFPLEFKNVSSYYLNKKGLSVRNVNEKFNDNEIEHTLDNVLISSNLLEDKKNFSIIDHDYDSNSVNMEKMEKYYIILGSFNSFTDAEFFYNNLLKKYTNLTILRKPNLNRVAIGPYYSKKDVLFYFDSLKKKDKNFIGWIYKE